MVKVGFDFETSENLAWKLSEFAGSLILHNWMSNYVLTKLEHWLMEVTKNPDWSERGIGQNFTAETSYEGKGKKMREFQTEKVVDFDEPNLQSKLRSLVRENTGWHNKI